MVALSWDTCPDHPHACGENPDITKGYKGKLDRISSFHFSATKYKPLI